MNKLAETNQRSPNPWAFGFNHKLYCLMNKQELIAMITPLIQRTHNEKDIADLQTFSVEELEEILTQINECF